MITTKAVSCFLSQLQLGTVSLWPQGNERLHLPRPSAVIARLTALLAITALSASALTLPAQADHDSRSRYPKETSKSVDRNSCIEGSVIGGLLGAGVGAALTGGSGRWVGVPVGAAAGALVGCQVDGG